MNRGLFRIYSWVSPATSSKRFHWRSPFRRRGESNHLIILSYAYTTIGGFSMSILRNLRKDDKFHRMKKYKQFMFKGKKYNIWVWILNLGSYLFQFSWVWSLSRAEMTNVSWFTIWGPPSDQPTWSCCLVPSCGGPVEQGIPKYRR